MLIVGLLFTFAEAVASVDIRKWRMSSTCAGPSGDIPLAGLQAAAHCWCSGLPFASRALFPSLGSWRTLSAAFSWEMHSIRVSPSQLSPKLCLFGPSNFWSPTATCKHSSISGKADVAEAELVCELDSKRETSHLAQCGKSLSSNQLQAKQLLMFFLIPL